MLMSIFDRMWERGEARREKRRERREERRERRAERKEERRRSGSDIDWLNYYLEKDNYDWQKEVQETTWDREDDAYQRKAADMEAAGLSKTLAAGGAGNPSGAIVHTDPPQKKNDVMMQKMALMTSAADLARTGAETLLMRQQASKTKQEVENTKAITIQNQVKAAVQEATKSAQIETEGLSLIAQAERARAATKYVMSTAQAQHRQDYLKGIKAQIQIALHENPQLAGQLGLEDYKADIAAARLIQIQERLALRDEEILKYMPMVLSHWGRPSGFMAEVLNAEPALQAIAQLVYKLMGSEGSLNDAIKEYQE